MKVHALDCDLDEDCSCGTKGIPKMAVRRKQKKASETLMEETWDALREWRKIVAGGDLLGDKSFELAAKLDAYERAVDRELDEEEALREAALESTKGKQPLIPVSAPYEENWP